MQRSKLLIRVGETYVTHEAHTVEIVHYSKSEGAYLGIVNNGEDTHIRYTSSGSVFGDSSNNSPSRIRRALKPRKELWLCKKADGSFVGPKSSPCSWPDHTKALKGNKHRLAEEGAKLVCMREV